MTKKKINKDKMIIKLNQQINELQAEIEICKTREQIYEGANKELSLKNEAYYYYFSKKPAHEMNEAVLIVKAFMAGRNKSFKQEDNLVFSEIKNSAASGCCSEIKDLVLTVE
jgi:hypothetical protein